MSFTYVLGKMLSLAVMMILGFIAKRRGILSAKTNRDLSELVVDITTPCMMLAPLSATEASRSDLLLMLAAGIVFYALFIAAAELAAKKIRCSEKEKPVFKYFAVFTNNAFMGFPVVRALWGNKALVYTSLLNIPVSILMYSYGIFQYARGAGKGEKFELKKLLNVPIISAVLVLILAMCSFKFTGPVQETLEIIGDATVPLSMIVIGSTLAESPVRGLIEDKRLYVCAFIRLLIVPVIVFGLVYFMPFDPLIKGVLVVISAMPGSANGVIFAQLYSFNRTLSSRYVFISTVLSVVTIPLMSVIILSPLGI